MENEIIQNALSNALSDIYALKKQNKRVQIYIIILLVIVLSLMWAVFSPAYAISELTACYHVYSDDNNRVLIYVRSYTGEEKTVEVCVDKCMTVKIPGNNRERRKLFRAEGWFENTRNALSDYDGNVFDLCIEFHYDIDYAVFQIHENGAAVEVQRNLRGDYFK